MYEKLVLTNELATDQRAYLAAREAIKERYMRLKNGSRICDTLFYDTCAAMMIKREYAKNIYNHFCHTRSFGNYYTDVPFITKCRLNWRKLIKG